MAPSFSLGALLCSLSFIAPSLALGSVCTQSPYAALLPLSNFPPAESYCSSKYPPAKCCTTTTTATRIATVTSTHTVSTLTLTTGTTTVSSAIATSTVTVTSVDSTTVHPTVTAPPEISTSVGTTTETDTATVTETDTSTSTATTTTTTTTTFTPVANDKRDATPYLLQLRPAATTLDAQKRGITSTSTKSTFTTSASSKRSSTTCYSSLWSSVSTHSPSILSTLCSCIESHPTCSPVSTTVTSTSTSVSSVTATSKVQATSTTSVTAITSTTTITTFTQSSAHTVTPIVGTVSRETDTTIDTTTSPTETAITATVTSTSTVTVTAAPIPSCSSGLTCNQGNQFEVECGNDANGDNGATAVTVQQGVTDYQQCIQNCSNEPACNGFWYDSTNSQCTLYDNIDSASVSADPYAVFGYYVGGC